MYLFKAKKNLDARDFDDYRRRLVDRAEKSQPPVFPVTPLPLGGEVAATGTASAKDPSTCTTSTKFDVQHSGMAAAAAATPTYHPSKELPDGIISPGYQAKRGVESETTTTRPVEYMGSFSASGENQNARAEQVRRQLMQMRNVQKLKPVLLIISLSGVRVSSRSGDSVYMAHALKRISYAACDPEYQQFSFLAREPKGRTDIQYCHAFRTQTSQEAEELNAILGNSFRMAYALETEGNSKIAAVPSFNELIEQQIVEQQKIHQRQLESERRNFEKRLSQISTPRVAERSAELKELRQRQAEEAEAEAERERMAGKERTTWAKQLVNRAKHWSPIGSSESSNDHVAGGTTDNGGARDSVNMNNSRPYGSPVMTLKEKIDTHYNSGHTNGSSCSCQLDSFLQQTVLTPTSTFSGSSRSGSGLDRNNSSNSNGVVKRTPPPRYKAATTSSPDYQNPSTPQTSAPQTSTPQTSATPDLVDGHQLTDNLCRPEIVRLRKQNNQLTGRPVSSRYINSSPPRIVDQQQGDGSPRPTDSEEQLKKTEPPGDNTRDQLKHAPWFQAGIPREQALEKLSQENIGAFIVRNSTTHPGCFALSVKVPKFDNPSGISNYLITRTPSAGFKVKGLEKEWQTLTALVTHHTVMQEMLPCTLRLPRNSRNPSFRDSDKDEEEEDYRKVCSSTAKNLPDLQA